VYKRKTAGVSDYQMLTEYQMLTDAVHCFSFLAGYEFTTLCWWIV